MGIRSSVMNFLGFGKPAARVFRRAYSGAMVSRLTSDWMSTQASADAEIQRQSAQAAGSFPRDGAEQSVCAASESGQRRST